MAAQVLHDYEVLSDIQLAACIARKETHAVRLVTQRNNQRLFRTAWSILKNRTEAEDAVQEAYVRAFTSISGFKGLSSLSTWLTRITINEALMRRRASMRRAAALNANSVLVMDEYREKFMDSPERRATPEATLMRKQLAKLLENAIAQLPESFRTVFVLREIECLSVEETAEALDILPETVKSRTSRARRRLQTVLDPELKNALGEAFPFAGADCAALTTRVLQRFGVGLGQHWRNIMTAQIGPHRRNAMLKTIVAAAALALFSIPTLAVAQPTTKLTDPQIAHIAYTAGQIDIAAAQQALKKSKNKGVRSFAREMLRDHKAVNVQALALCKKLGVTPEDNDTSRSLVNDATAKREEYAKLKGADFDKAYAENEVAYHKTVNTTLENTLIPDTTNGELKDLLSTGLKLFQEHEHHAEDLAGMMK